MFKEEDFYLKWSTNRHNLFKKIPKGYAYVYLTYDKYRDMLYIGSTDGRTVDYLGSGMWIYSVIQKRKHDLYIRPIFWHSDLKYVRKVEAFFLNYFKVVENPLYYNLTYRTEGGGNITCKTDEERLEIKEKQKISYRRFLDNLTEEQQKERNERAKNNLLALVVM